MDSVKSDADDEVVMLNDIEIEEEIEEEEEVMDFVHDLKEE